MLILNLEQVGTGEMKLGDLWDAPKKHLYHPTDKQVVTGDSIMIGFVILKRLSPSQASMEQGSPLFEIFDRTKRLLLHRA